METLPHIPSPCTGQILMHNCMNSLRLTLIKIKQYDLWIKLQLHTDAHAHTHTHTHTHAHTHTCTHKKNSIQMKYLSQVIKYSIEIDTKLWDGSIPYHG